MTLGQKLQKAREARGLTQDQIARALGVSGAAVSQWENDATRPRMPKLQAIAGLLQVDMAWLVDSEQPAESTLAAADRPARLEVPSQRAVPVISYVQAGHWAAAETGFDADTAQEFIATELPVSKATFALIVEGLSMAPEFLPGDKVIVDPRRDPSPGAIVVAQLDDEPRATLKRYRDRGQDRNGVPIIELAPLNNDFPTLRIDAESPGRIVGVVVEHRRAHPRMLTP